MTTGELITLYTTGFTLVLAILFLAVWISRANDHRPLAKIRVKTDDRIRRSAAPADENEAVQTQGLVAGLILTILIVTAILTLLNNS